MVTRSLRLLSAGREGSRQEEARRSKQEEEEDQSRGETQKAAFDSLTIRCSSLGGDSQRAATRLGAVAAMEVLLPSSNPASWCSTAGAAGAWPAAEAAALEHAGKLKWCQLCSGRRRSVQVSTGCTLRLNFLPGTGTAEVSCTRLLVKTCSGSSLVALMVAFTSFLQTYKIYIYKVLKQVHPVSAALFKYPQADAQAGRCLPVAVLLICHNVRAVMAVDENAHAHEALSTPAVLTPVFEICRTRVSPQRPCPS
jgi:hypothetical protein